MREIQKTLKLYTYDEAVKKLEKNEKFFDVKERLYQNLLNELHEHNHKDKVIELAKKYFEFDEEGLIYVKEDN